MSDSLVIVDCPACRGDRTVVLGTYGMCVVCFAEFRADDEGETLSRREPEAIELSQRC